MAESVVSSIAERLGDLFIEEAKFLRGVRGQVEEMQFELELMQSYLEDADKKQYEDKRVQICVARIRELAYDAEAVIGTFVLKIASRRRRGIRGSFKRYACITNEAAELHKIGSEIEAIKTSISNVTRCLETYGIKHIREGEGSSSAQQRQQRWRESYFHVEEDTVGLDNDIKDLVAKLVNEENPLVSIWGMGGLGKTTLAKKVYHHSEIRGHFDRFAWVYISQQFQTRDVWQGILFHLISPSPKEREEILKLRDEELIDELSKVLKEGKCLVIIDDIWTTEAWDSLSLAFHVGKSRSQMLLTTRNGEVARRGLLHELRHLTEEESWELFKKKAFPGKDEAGVSNEDKEKFKLQTEIVKKCAGLPLAIVVLGGLLATKRTSNEWQMMCENIDSYLRAGKGHEEQHSVSGVLALSYHELPYRLKPCFLHLGNFPEDFDIPKTKLVRLWVAEGIVSHMQSGVEGEETIEDVAELYLGELVDRCMVQVGKRSSSGRIKTCRLHDLMRDLCQLKAKQENFLRIVDLQGQNRQVDSSSSIVTITKTTHRVHRLAVYGEETLKFFPELESTMHLRSLYFFNTTNDNNENFRKMTSWFRNFKLLQILDLERNLIKGNLLIREIGNLIHLKYLSVCFSSRTKIPSSIGNLRCLQTLVLYGDVSVPNVIWKMVQLRHLYFTSIRSRSGKLGLGDLRNLQTLQQFDIRNFNVEELTKLTNLRKLYINMGDSLQELKKILTSSPPRVDFYHLRSLKIDWSGFTMEETDLQRIFSTCHNLYNLNLTDQIVKLPEYRQFPKNLTKLTLFLSKLSEDPMPTLEKLPYLTILCLSYKSFIGLEMVCSSKGFPQLKSLVVDELLNLTEWRVGEEEEEIRFVGEEAAMPNLCELKIEGCGNLKKIPNGLRFITTLQKLEIRGMPTNFRNRLQQGGEDYDKVRDVHSITFENIY